MNTQTAVVHTVMCDKFGCLWQGSTEDFAEAEQWGIEHPHSTFVISEVK